MATTTVPTNLHTYREIYTIDAYATIISFATCRRLLDYRTYMYYITATHFKKKKRIIFNSCVVDELLLLKFIVQNISFWTNYEVLTMTSGCTYFAIAKLKNNGVHVNVPFTSYLSLGRE